jgi:hypothetical protein
MSMLSLALAMEDRWRIADGFQGGESDSGRMEALSKQSAESMLKELKGKVSPRATMIMLGIDNDLFDEEHEDGGGGLYSSQTRRGGTMWREA